MPIVRSLKARVDIPLVVRAARALELYYEYTAIHYATRYSP